MGQLYSSSSSSNSSGGGGGGNRSVPVMNIIYLVTFYPYVSFSSHPNKWFLCVVKMNVD